MDSSKIVSLCLIGGSILISGLLYKFFTKEDLISLIKKEFHKNKNCLSKEIALKIILAGVKNGELSYQKTNQEIEINRRKHLNDDEYDERCEETLNCKQESYDKAMEKIIEKFEGKFSVNTLNEIAGYTSMQLSHILYKFDKPFYTGKLPSVEQAIEVYKFYVDYITQGLSEVKIPKSENMFELNDLYFKMYYLNLKVNDIIFEKYPNLNDQIVKYVLWINHKFEEEEFKRLEKSIEIFDKIILSS